MKPVFVSEKGGGLYQTGFKQLDGMPETKLEFYTRDITMAIAVSQHLVQFFGVTVHLPFGDNKQWAGPNADLAGTIRAAAKLLQSGKHVLVYCYYGRNRSGLVAALIIRQVLGCTGAEALARLRMTRRGACGGNQHFVNYLEELPAP